MIRSILIRLALVAGVQLTNFAQAWADVVTLELQQGLTARAEYRAGARDKPAVLILHGFLQTHNFPTVHNLAEGLVTAGYSVLTPTLTLGGDTPPAEPAVRGGPHPHPRGQHA